MYFPTTKTFHTFPQDNAYLAALVKNGFHHTLLALQRELTPTTFSWQGSPIRSDFVALYYSGFNFYNEVYQTGDFVLITSKQNKTLKPQIGMINFCSYAKRTKSCSVGVTLFARPEDIGLAAQTGKEVEIDENKTFKWELFATVDNDIVSIASVRGKCTVAHISELPDAKGFMSKASGKHFYIYYAYVSPSHSNQHICNLFK